MLTDCKLKALAYVQHIQALKNKCRRLSTVIRLNLFYEHHHLQTFHAVVKSTMKLPRDMICNSVRDGFCQDRISHKISSIRVRRTSLRLY